jgi:SPP1 family predicted phage head-tail adaptor
LHIEKKAGDGVEIGELKQRITFQKQVTARNENGFEVESWQDYKTVWAKVENLSGREYYQAAAVQAEKTIIFVVRYIAEIGTMMRILFEGKQYNITSVDNKKYENKYLEIKAMEVVKNG